MAAALDEEGTDNLPYHVSIVKTSLEENLTRGYDNEMETTRYRGVRWRPDANKYEAVIRYGVTNQLNLGRFDDIKHAARVYDIAAQLLHRGNAVLNFPKDSPPEVLLLSVINRIRSRPNCPETICKRLDKAKAVMMSPSRWG